MVNMTTNKYYEYYLYSIENTLYIYPKCVINTPQTTNPITEIYKNYCSEQVLNVYHTQIMIVVLLRGDIHFTSSTQPCFLDSLIVNHGWY